MHTSVSWFHKVLKSNDRNSTEGDNALSWDIILLYFMFNGITISIYFVKEVKEGYAGLDSFPIS